MTPFRRNLEQLRRDHHAERYPGDLVAELLDSGKFNPADAQGDVDAPAGERHALLDDGVTGGPFPITRGAAARRWRTLFLPLASTAAIAATIAVGLTLAIVQLNDNGPADGLAVKDPAPSIAPSKPTNLGTAGPDQKTTATAGTASQTDATATTPSTAETFTVVPTVVAVVGEDYSLVPAAPSFDFDLSASAADTNGGGEMADD